MTDFAHPPQLSNIYESCWSFSNKWMSTTPDPNFAPLTRLFPTTKHTTSMIKINKNNHQPVILPFQEPAFGIGNSPTTIDFPRRFSSFSSFTVLPEYLHVPKKNQNKKIKNAKKNLRKRRNKNDQSVEAASGLEWGTLRGSFWRFWSAAKAGNSNQNNP